MPWLRTLTIATSLLLVPGPLHQAQGDELGIKNIGAGELGDRLVLSINAVPYTQRHVEAYISVREALRPNSLPNSDAVVAENWREALATFGEDMIILQEAQRLGGFQAEPEILARYFGIILGKIPNHPALRSALTRLGYDNQGVNRLIDEILRVELFRRSKNRVASGLDSKPPGANDKNAGPSKSLAIGKDLWLTELRERSVIRHYQNAERYLRIVPPPAKRPLGH